MPLPNYSTENLLEAFGEVDEGVNSIRNISKKWNIPYSSLQKKLKARTVFVSKAGAIRYLSEGLEDKLVEYILGCSARGIHITF